MKSIPLSSQKTTYVLHPESFTDSLESNGASDLESFQREGIDIPPTETIDEDLIPLPIPFQRLLNGKEPLENVNLRYQLFLKQWSIQRDRIENVLKVINGGTFQSLKNQITSVIDTAKIPTFFLPNISDDSIRRLNSYLESDKNMQLVNLYGNDNLKTCLTKIVLNSDYSTEFDDGADLDSDDEGPGEGIYNKTDLNILASNWDVRKFLLLNISQADLFDVGTLIKLLTLLSRYTKMIKIRVILGITTSITIFQEKLPRQVLAMIEGFKYELDNSSLVVDQILNKLLFENVSGKVTGSLGGRSLNFGPNILRTIHRRNIKSNQSINSTISILKYGYMLHFFQQPLTIFWEKKSVKNLKRNSDYARILRLLPSFKQFIESTMKDSSIPEFERKKIVQQLLNNDEELLSLVPQSLEKFSQWQHELYQCLNFLIILQLKFMDYGPHMKSKFELYYDMLTDPSFLRSKFVKSMLSSIETSTPLKVFDFVAEISDLASNELFSKFMETFQGAPTSILEKFTPDGVYFQPELDTLKGLSKDAKIELGLLNQHIVSQVLHTVESVLVPLREDSLLFSEICTVDCDEKYLSSVFTPNIRDNVQSVLLDPRMHLQNSYYTSEKMNIRPMISELYGLYREASSQINIYDFYSAFKQRLEKDAILEVLELKSIDESEWDQISLSWFLQGLLELNLLGFVKESKNRRECVDKLIWKDL
ncbi:hypothetical protein LJB42_003619 [Komagataella kurtzmanii]|nr:hypothetical protein LJB42_003619 [Komagataella kurtzmanii]